MKFPDSFPPDLNFDLIAENTYDKLASKLEKTYLRERNTFVDKQFELDDPSVIALTDKITAKLIEHEDGFSPTDINANLVGYQAFFFAYRLGGLIHPASIEGFAASYKEIGELVDGSEDVLELAQIYLANRPTIDGIIGAYMAEIDNNASYPHVAETMAALVLMHMESELYIREGIDEITRSLKEN